MNSRRLSSYRRAAIAGAVVSLILVACSPAAGGSPSESTAASASASDAASPSGHASATPTAAPTDELGAFSCKLPIEGDGTVARAQISDVRVGTHDGYDRVVIEFEDGIPPYILQKAMPPLLSDPAGMEMDVEGAAFLNLVLMGGTRVTEDGEFTYDGRTDFRPAGFPVLAELVESGDFEATSAWYLGLKQKSCVRVLTMADPSRLVIDIQQ